MIRTYAGAVREHVSCPSSRVCRSRSFSSDLARDWGCSRRNRRSRRNRERVPRKVRRAGQTQGKEARTVTARLDMTLDRATGTRLVVVGLGLIARSNAHRDIVDRPSKQEKLMMLILLRYGL